MAFGQHAASSRVAYNLRVAKKAHSESGRQKAADPTKTSWRVIEFFAGIGGFACAAAQVLQPRLQQLCRSLDITAIDIDEDARSTYQLNWPHDYWIREIESLDAATLAPLQADMWWLSPPCQPYSRRGQQRDIDDPRARSLLHLIELVEPLRPKVIALENVSGFANSHAFVRLESTLLRLGYAVQCRQLCPTELGWPNRRPRFYMLASLTEHCPLQNWTPLPRYTTSIAELLEGIAGHEHSISDHSILRHSNSEIASSNIAFNGKSIDGKNCQLDAADIARFSSAMDRIDLSDSQAITACFGSSYGKSLLHAGSYVSHPGDLNNLRRFEPPEVARLLGFPAEFVLPQRLSYRRQWKLLGNSLSIPAMKYLLAHIEVLT